MRKVPFASFVKLQRGFDLPTDRRIEGPYPVVAATSIHGFHAEYKVLPPGVVTGRSGALGEVLYITSPFWPLNTALWVKDFKGNLPRYVYYHLKTLNLASYNSGAGVPTLNRNHLDTLEVAVPPLPVQRKIAAILGAYDDLIEVNLRRIALLEEAARGLYREWFVRFRFPGHEGLRLVDSPLGKVPEGWEVVKLTQLADVNVLSIKGDSGPREIGYIDISSVTMGFINKTERMSFDAAPGRARRIVKHGDTIWSMVRPNRRSYGLIPSVTS